MSETWVTFAWRVNTSSWSKPTAIRKRAKGAGKSLLWSRTNWQRLVKKSLEFARITQSRRFSMMCRRVITKTTQLSNGIALAFVMKVQMRTHAPRTTNTLDITGRSRPWLQTATIITSGKDLKANLRAKTMKRQETLRSCLWLRKSQKRDIMYSASHFVTIFLLGSLQKKTTRRMSDSPR